jgi:uncharacterized protein YecE (DUF72 family)
MAAAAAQIRIGISGWRYVPWRGRFYPKDLPQKRELDYASRCFNSIELNGSFYSLQWPSSYQRWYEQTPDDFVFSIKGGRYITHMRKLRDAREPLANFLASGLLKLREKLGPFLWQFPAVFRYNDQTHQRLADFFELLPRDTQAAAKLASEHGKTLKKGRAWTQTDAKRPLRHAIEIRHHSFLDARFIKLLREHNVALVYADTAQKWPYAEDVTADFVYLRLHGDKELYASGYSDEALEWWAARIERWRNGQQPDDAKLVASGMAPKKRKSRDIYAYFDNDVKVMAPVDAMRLSRRLGIEITPPSSHEIKTGGGEEPRKTGPHFPGTRAKKPTPSRVR